MGGGGMKETLYSHILWLIAFNIVMVLLGYGITVRPAWQKRFWELPRAIQKLYVFFFMAPIIMMPLVPQPRYADNSIISIILGAAIIMTAAFFWISALWQMKGVPSVRQSTGLVTGGVYRIVRNPIYTANWLILPGMGLIFHSIAALVYTPFWFVLLAVLSLLEEKSLLKQYGCAYRDYINSTPYRLLVYVF